MRWGESQCLTKSGRIVEGKNAVDQYIALFGTRGGGTRRDTYVGVVICSPERWTKELASQPSRTTIAHLRPCCRVGRTLYPALDFLERQPKAKRRRKAIVVLLVFKRRRAQVGRHDVQMEVPRVVEERAHQLNTTKRLADARKRETGEKGNGRAAGECTSSKEQHETPTAAQRPHPPNPSPYASSPRPSLRLPRA